MSPANRTKILILATIALWAVFDLATDGQFGVDPTISRVVLAWHWRHPWVAFSVGVLVGHLFFPQPIPDEGGPMLDHSALARYADNHPELTTNATLATAYGSATVTVRRRLLPISELLQWGGSGPIDSIDAAQSFTNPNPAVQRGIRAAAKAAIKMFGSTDTFDLDSPINRTLLAGFVAGGVCSQTEADSLIGLGDVAAPLHSQPGEFGVIPTAEDFAALHVRES